MSNPAFRSPVFQKQAASAQGYVQTQPGLMAGQTAQALGPQQTLGPDQTSSAGRSPLGPAQSGLGPYQDLPASERMSYQDTLVKSGITFAVMLLGAVAGWIFSGFALQRALAGDGGSLGAVTAIWIVAALVGFVLGMVNAFKREPSPALILLYAAVQGVFLGSISNFFEYEFPGIVLEAVIATIVVVAVTLALFASGKIRASARATKVFLIAMVGYIGYSLVNVVLMWTGVNSDPWGLGGSVKLFGIPLGVILGLLAVLMGAYSLVIDFDFIQRGVQNGAPKKYGWSGAFGIMVTVIWLYIEILRLLAIARQR